jgi:hypothetical protein
VIDLPLACNVPAHRPAKRVSARNRAVGWLRTRDHWSTSVMLLFFGGLSLAGVTTSSIGMSFLRQDPGAPLGRQLWQSQGIRSDEYNALTPIDLSIMSTGGAPTLSPLGEHADLLHRFSSGGFFETIVFFDSTMLRAAAFLPDAMVFAAHWWLPVATLFFFMPRWFAQVGASRRMGWLAAMLIALSPCVAWWSMQPIQLLAYTLAGSSLMLSSYERFSRQQRWRALGLALVGGVLIAGMPTAYVPWSLVLGAPILLASSAWLLSRSSPLLLRCKPLLLTATTALVFGVGTLLENLDGIRSTLATVYPGSRRSGSMAEPLGFLFGAPGLGKLQDTAPVLSNASELSTSFAICFVWVFVLLLRSTRRFHLREHVVPATIGLFGLLWLAWITVSSGVAGTKVPVLNLVTPDRATQVVGILGVMLVALVLPSVRSDDRWSTPVAAGLVCGAVTLYAVSRLQMLYLPTTRLTSVWLSGAAVVLVVTLVTRYPRRTWPVLLTAAIAAVPVYRANPLLVGLADLHSSTSAQAMQSAGATARAAGTLWVSDVGQFDVLMLANGVPSLSGLQRAGPDRAEWEKLDPAHQFETAWNRAGGYVPFVFAEGEPIQITTNGFDVTIVRADPCVLTQRMPNLAHVATRQQLAVPCLRPAGKLVWGGGPVNLYDVRD